MFGGTLAIDGHLARDILFYGEEVNINGSVGGTIQQKGHTLIIGSGAQIDGPIHFQGEHPPTVSPSAKLASPVEFKQMEKKEPYRESRYYIWQVIWAAAYILFGLVLFLLMPEFSKEAVNSSERYGASAGMGFLVFFGVPIAAIAACITVVGLFIGISAGFLWYASLYYAQIIIGALVGQWLLGRTNETWPLIGRMVVGIMIVRLCTIIPHAGGWIKYLVAVWGLGAISLALYRRFQPMLAPSFPPAPYQAPMPPNTTLGGTLPT
jgi:hypothetical protein